MLATGGSDGYCHIWNFQTTRSCTKSIKVGKEVTSAIILDPYSLLLVGDTEGVVVVWEMITTESAVVPLRRLVIEGPHNPHVIISNLAVLRLPGGDDCHIFGTTDGGEVYQWDLSTTLQGLDHIKREYSSSSSSSSSTTIRWQPFGVWAHYYLSVCGGWSINLGLCFV